MIVKRRFQCAVGSNRLPSILKGSRELGKTVFKKRSKIFVKGKNDQMDSTANASVSDSATLKRVCKRVMRMSSLIFLFML